jgi:protein-S-isoprenylcysteine O-methyltransferase Ste14
MTTLHASWLEVVQMFTACVGLILAMWALWIAADDAIELTGGAGILRDLRRLVALGNLRAQMARTLVHGLLVLIGMVMVMLPPPPDLVIGTGVAEQDGFVLVGLICITTVLTFDAMMDRRHRYVFMAHVQTVEPRNA